MVRRAYTQRSLIEVLLPDSDKFWDPVPRQMDVLLEDDDLVDRIAEALARRHPQSRRRGRLGTLLRKGKLAKPTEFGRLVKIQEAEAQFITDYQVCERGVSDRALWVPTLDRHVAFFARPPHLAVADGGIASPANEHEARARGVRHIVLPRHPRDTRSRTARVALRWRTGSEGRMSALKRRHGLRRCRYLSESGMQRWIGLGVIANDLLVLGRAGP